MGIGRVCTPEQLPDRLTSFVFHLLSMDNRIRLYPMFGEVDPNKGFFLTKEHIYIPYLLPTIEHDVAHLLEMRNPQRWTMPDLGMSRFEDEEYKPSKMFAAFSREVRTRAIQTHMMRFETQQQKLDSTAYSQLNNPYWVDIARKCLPFGRFKSIEDVHNYNADLRARTHKRWCLDRIEHTWKIRLSHIQNYMETAT